MRKRVNSFLRKPVFVAVNRKKQSWQEMRRAGNNYWKFWEQIRTGAF